MKKLLTVLVCLCVLVAGFAALVASGNDNAIPAIRTNNPGYITEEEVFAALAFTYNDLGLMEKINSMQSPTPNGHIIEGFHAKDYSEYMNDQYGGMYINDHGGLVLCYVKDTAALFEAEKRNKSNARTLSTPSNKTFISPVIVEGVKFSYKDLLDAYDLLNEIIPKYGVTDVIYTCGIDIQNNRIVIEMSTDARGDPIESELTSMFDEEMVFFVRANMEKFQYIATINGTSAINNGSVSSTPAGQMYSSSKGNYGIITCAHGYANGNSIYSGLTTTTKIGTITDRVFSSTNDASYIVLSSGHSYVASTNLVDEISTNVPMVNSYITLRGYMSGIISSAKVTSNSASFYVGSDYNTDHIAVDKGMQSGDSGGGAIGGTIDLGRTNLIIGINRSSNGSVTNLVKGSYIWNAFK